MATITFKKRFQFFDAEKNSNKYWQIEVFDDGFLQTEFGRVGVVNPPSRKRGTQVDADKLVREKERKGYKEVKLHVPDVVVVGPATAAHSNSTLDAKVKSFVDLVFEEAGQNTQSFLSVGVDALDQSQIDDARKVLANVALRHKRMTADEVYQQVKTFYTLIPTKMPSKIDKAELVGTFTLTVDELDERLDQLSAAIAGYKTRVVQGNSGIESLGGIKLEALRSETVEYQRMVDEFVNTRARQNWHIDSILSAEIPAERKEFDDNDFGKSKLFMLYHGTDNKNLQYILRSGLICPPSYSHGRYYGNGIYFSPQSEKSCNYIGGRYGSRVLLICEVAVGNQQVAYSSCYSRNQPDTGYHSVKSARTPSGNDEIIVYNKNQVTIRAIARLERGQ